jgi:hypothetical protein
MKKANGIAAMAGFSPTSHRSQPSAPHETHSITATERFHDRNHSPFHARRRSLLRRQLARTSEERFRDVM